MVESKTTPVQFSISTGIDIHTGISLIKLKIGETEINLMPDSAAQISLELLSVSYRARTMADLYVYAKKKKLSLKDLGLEDA